MLAALLIFAGTYLVLAIGRLPGFRLDRTGATIIGATLMIVCRVLTLEEAYRADRLRHHHPAVRHDDRGRQPAALGFLSRRNCLGGGTRAPTDPAAGGDRLRVGVLLCVLRERHHVPGDDAAGARSSNRIAAESG